MSSIRLQGTSSGYYDLTVPAAAGTNSIDLSNLVVNNTAASLTGPLTVSGDIIRNDTTTGIMKFALQYNGSDAAVFKRNNATGVTTISNGYAGAAVDSLNIDLGGRVTTPNVPAFHCASSGSNTSTGAFILGSTDKGQSISAVINNGNHYNTGNGRFTAPVAGLYFFSAMASPSQGANSGIYIEKNGSQVSGAAYVYGQSYNGSSVSAVVQLAIGDYAMGVHVPFNGTTEGQYSGNFTGFLIG